jgi:DNA-binding NarL/FixJ family response regulator
MSIKVAIVEDSAGVRENWAKLIGAEPGFECVGASDSGEAALKRFPATRPDVVLMDINLPGMSGIQCTALLKAKLPRTQILIVTVYADNDHVFEALKVGASGYLLKCTDPAELTRSIADVMRGGAPMSGQIARRVIEVFRRPVAPAGNADTKLTPREEETLDLLAKGYANKEIASRLGASVETVRVHVRHIYEKLQVHSRTEAAAKYLTSAAGDASRGTHHPA